MKIKMDLILDNEIDSQLLCRVGHIEKSWRKETNSMGAVAKIENHFSKKSIGLVQELKC